jgi:subtilisin family serine protease
MKKLIVPAVLSLGLVAAANARPMSSEIPHVPGEVVVKIKKGFMGKFLGKKELLGAQLTRNLKLVSGEFVVLKSSSKSALSLVTELKRLPEVDYAEPNFIYKAINNTSDPLYGKLWGLTNTGNNEPDRNGGNSGSVGVSGADINAEKAWGITKGSKNVVIAVIDTGIDYNHPDLKDNIWTNSKEIAGNNIDDDGNGYIDDIHGWNAFAKNGNPLDGNSHGTHCAGTIGAKHGNGVGVAGVMDEVSLMAVKFLSDEGSGSLADAVVAIDYATKMNVDLMSNSWGGGGFSQTLEDAIKAAKAKGILFVAAAGNNGTNNDSAPHYPSNYQVDNVVSVAAHTNQDSLASFSCFGKRTVHVAAPGHNILSTTPNNNYKVYSGTSMATPHVSGVIGLFIAQEGRQDVKVVRDRLMATTVPAGAYRKTTIAGGRVDAYNFLTDTRIPRQGPDESAWRVEPLASVFETTHPYANNAKITKTYNFPGAKYVKFVIEKYETEANYDFVIIKDGKGSVVEKISGAGQNYETDYAETESVTVEFTSDSSEARFGTIIKNAKVIY